MCVFVFSPIIYYLFIFLFVYLFSLVPDNFNTELCYIVWKWLAAMQTSRDRDSLGLAFGSSPNNGLISMSAARRKQIPPTEMALALY